MSDTALEELAIACKSHRHMAQKFEAECESRGREVEQLKYQIKRLDEVGHSLGEKLQDRENQIRHLRDELAVLSKQFELSKRKRKVKRRG